ncbi:MAG: C69 family dipeptidase [Bacteroidales bacterium]|nr:C69 family dipeptidase [Bacteroidales bacterium]MBN2819634.1 C69 family dipeptidase [Bacteroidales bacterium]
MKKIIFSFLITAALYNTSNACTNFLISKGATTDGSTMITYAADSHTLYGELYYWDAAKHVSGDSLKVYEWDTGKYLGKIKQVKETYRVVGNINQHQVAIGETTYGGRQELVDTTAIMDYGSLIYITLQRARTAREAIKIMDELVAEYGYYSSGESFSIADPEEVWIMEMIGKGLANKGAVWVAQRVPDGYISGHANQSRITTFTQNDPENCLFSSDVIEFAREQGYFDGKDKNFDFSAAYAPLDFGGARFCEARVYSGFKKVNAEIVEYEQHAMGYELESRMPLWVKVDKKITVKDVMGLMRDYFQNTPMDMTKDFGAGSNACIVRWRPLTWEVDGKTYFNERAISTQQTGFSFVAQMRDWLPDPVGGILWFGVDDTYSTVYTPVFCGISKTPHVFEVGNGGMMDFSETSAFWLFNQVSNFAYTRYNLMIPHIQEKQSLLEDGYVSRVMEIDEKIKKIENEEEQIAYLTQASAEMGQNTFDEWKSLYHFLFARYMDGNVKTKREVPAGYIYVEPDIEQPGYSDYWYKKLVDETGEKFLYQGEESH